MRPAMQTMPQGGHSGADQRAERCRAFRDGFTEAHRHALADAEAQVYLRAVDKYYEKYAESGVIQNAHKAAIREVTLLRELLRMLAEFCPPNEEATCTHA